MAVDMPTATTRFGKTENPLRIAMVAPPWFELPPTGYGGIEALVADLVDTLTERGHEVTLIGAGRNRTRASNFVALFPEPLWNRLGEAMPEVLHAAGAAETIDGLDVDVVHDNTLAGPLLARARDVPTVITAHGPVSGESGDYLRRLGKTVQVVAISDAQRRMNPTVNWAGLVYNAIDVTTYPFRETKDDYLLFLGRFNPEKGPHLAIDAARAAGRRIILAGKVNEDAEKAYFQAEIEPRLNQDATFVGEADAKRKRELYAGARCMLFPIQWEEPFGIVMIEAMACGTPVVALRRGSVPEVVRDGVTGIIADEPAELPAGIAAAEDLSPAACRAHVEANFDLPAMATGYEQVYTAVVEARQT